MNSLSVLAQVEGLDEDFGTSGIDTTDLGTNYDVAKSVVLQSDGKIIVGGEAKYNFGLVRYHSNGQKDETFGTNGIVTTDFDTSIDRLFAITMQIDGKIIAVGNGGPLFSIGLVRYLNDGSLDNSFGDNGKVITSIDDFTIMAVDVIVRPNGKILVGGFIRQNGLDFDEDFCLTQYNTDGTLDHDFGESGMVITDFGNGSRDFAKSMILQPDGRVVLVGSVSGSDETTFKNNFALIRYDVDGTLDESFGVNGLVTTDFDDTYDLANDVVLQTNGKIVLAGYSNYPNSISLSRYSQDGTLDSSFGEGGKVALTTMGNRANSIVTDPDGKLLLSVASSLEISSFGLIRLHENGEIDTDFGQNGKVTIDNFGNRSVSNDLVIQTDGKIVVVGEVSYVLEEWSGPTYHVDFAIARYIPDLSIVTTNNFPGLEAIQVFPNPITENTFLKYELANEFNISLHFCNIEGRVLKTYFENRPHKAGPYEQKLSLPNSLSSGVYYLVFSANGKQSVVKLLK